MCLEQEQQLVEPFVGARLQLCLGGGGLLQLDADQLDGIDDIRRGSRH